MSTLLIVGLYIYIHIEYTYTYIIIYNNNIVRTCILQLVYNGKSYLYSVKRLPLHPHPRSEKSMEALRDPRRARKHLAVTLPLNGSGSRCNDAVQRCGWPRFGGYSEVKMLRLVIKGNHYYISFLLKSAFRIWYEFGYGQSKKERSILGPYLSPKKMGKSPYILCCKCVTF